MVHVGTPSQHKDSKGFRELGAIRREIFDETTQRFRFDNSIGLDRVREVQQMLSDIESHADLMVSTYKLLS